MDTSALYPLFWMQGDLTQVCKEVLQELIEKYEVGFLTSTWIKYETLSKLKNHGIEFCKKFDEFLIKANVSVEYVSKSIEDEASKTFWGYQDKKWSFIDCASIYIMRDKNILYAFAADDHFSQAGLIPLMEYDPIGRAKKSYVELVFYYL